MKKQSWPFHDNTNVVTISTKNIFFKKEPILYVYHGLDDGMWTFFSDSNPSQEDATVVSLKEVYALDQSIGLLCDMPIGYCAYRASPSAKWTIRKYSEES